MLTIFGTRPEAIKLAPVIRELDKGAGFRSRLCITGQHRELLDQVLRLFKLKPDFDLNVMLQNQSLFDLTTRILRGLESVFRDEKPDIVLLQGDTTTVLAACLAAHYLRIRIGHVEAGLRSFDKYNPFPEETNRRVADLLSDFHFAPTEAARQHLLKEGIAEQQIVVTGNTVIDALLMTLQRQADEQTQRRFESHFQHEYGIPFDNKRVVLVTGHRRESFGAGFERICLGLRKIAEGNKNVAIVYPVHLNPNVKEPVFRILGAVPNIHLIPPVEYASFVWLLSRSYVVLTDSGGIQEEAPSLSKPVLVMRSVTERTEAVEAGAAKLVGTDDHTIAAETQRLLDDKETYLRMAQAANPYGDGKAGRRIVSFLEGRLLPKR